MPPSTSHTAGFTRTVDDLWPNRLARGKQRFRNELAKLREPGQIAGGASEYVNRLAQMGTEERLRNASAMGVPVASDVAGLAADALMYKRDPESRTPGNALLSGLGLLPFIPAMTAYHGSPHKFDKFELSDKTIGTGEGAQAYGHGLYFAENKDVAKGYQAGLDRQVPLFNGNPVTAPINGVPESDILQFAREKLAGNSRDAYVRSVLERARKYDEEASRALDKWAKKDAIVEAGSLRELADNAQKIDWAQLGFGSSGALYEVDIPDDRIAQMLDWDAPLSEQPEAVRKALESIIEDIKQLPDTILAVGERAYLDNPATLKGGDVYNMGRRYFGGDDLSGKATSDRLRSLGIPGIRYLDGASRADGKGTRNFVVFDDSIVKILNRE